MNTTLRKALRWALPAAAIVAAPLVLAAPASATLISVGLQQAGVNGGAITTVATDGGLGAVSYIGSYGTFSLNNISATGAPAIDQGSLNTTSVQVSGGLAGTIAVYITETGLTSPLGLTSFLSSFTSNLFSGAASQVVESTYVSLSNALYGGTLMASSSFTGIGTSVSPNQTNLTGAAYSETVKYLVTVGAGSSNVNDTINLTATAVPEPLSLALFGAGLVGLVAFSRRRTTSGAAFG